MGCQASNVLLKQAYDLLMSNQGQIAFQLKVINVSVYVDLYSLYTGKNILFD